MKTLNRSEIFKNAWSLVKSTGATLSAALKQAWAQAKGLVVSAAKVYTGITGNIERKLDEFKSYCEKYGADFKAVLQEERDNEEGARVYFDAQLLEYREAFKKNEGSLADFRATHTHPATLCAEALKAYFDYQTLTGKVYQF